MLFVYLVDLFGWYVGWLTVVFVVVLICTCLVVCVWFWLLFLIVCTYFDVLRVFCLVGWVGLLLLFDGSMLLRCSGVVLIVLWWFVSLCFLSFGIKFLLDGWWFWFDCGCVWFCGWYWFWLCFVWRWVIFTCLWVDLSFGLWFCVIVMLLFELRDGGCVVGCWALWFNVGMIVTLIVL